MRAIRQQNKLDLVEQTGRKLYPASATLVDSPVTSAYWVSEHSLVPYVDPHPSDVYNKHDYVCSLALVASSSACQMVEAASCHENVDMECFIISVEEPVIHYSKSTLPRRRHSLISQCTHKRAVESEKRLADGSGDPPVDGDAEFNSDLMLGSRARTLMTIPLTSPLGIRIKKAANRDPGIQAASVGNAEYYCTVNNAKQIFTNLRGSKVIEYSNVFSTRRRKAACGQYCHMYKFNSAERREFMSVLCTGLNVRSCRLLSQLKRCYVILRKLSESCISYHTLKKKSVVVKEFVIDNDISITQIDIPMKVLEAVSPCRSYPVLLSKDASPAVNEFPECDDNSYSRYTQCIPANFLVKQVNKNWTEIGKESQKLVFVPLENSGRCRFSTMNRSHSAVDINHRSASVSTELCMPHHTFIQHDGSRTVSQKNDGDVARFASDRRFEHQLNPVTRCIGPEMIGALQQNHGERIRWNERHPVPTGLYRRIPSSKMLQAHNCGEGCVQTTEHATVPRVVTKVSSIGTTFFPSALPGNSITTEFAQNRLQTSHRCCNSSDIVKLNTFNNMSPQFAASNALPASHKVWGEVVEKDVDIQGNISGLSIISVYGANELCDRKLAASLGLTPFSSTVTTHQLLSPHANPADHCKRELRLDPSQHHALRLPTPHLMHKCSSHFSNIGQNYCYQQRNAYLAKGSLISQGQQNSAEALTIKASTATHMTDYATEVICIDDDD